ncbi:MAG: type II secretion system F family protein, partial [Bacteroidota bacterium]
MEGLDRLLKKEIVLFGKSFGNAKKEHFYTELGVLVKAGIHLREALQIISENQKKKNLTELYESMVQDLDAGQSFYQVLRKRKFFSEYECYSVQIGEESGRLDEILEELGSFFGTKNQQRKQL